MQLLFDESDEFGFTRGVGYFKGKVKSFKNFDSNLNTFVGWNRIEYDKSLLTEKFFNQNKILNSSYYL